MAAPRASTITVSDSNKLSAYERTFAREAVASTETSWSLAYTISFPITGQHNM
jgi:hypothetical protein